VFEQLVGDVDRVGLAISLDLEMGYGFGEPFDTGEDFDFFVGVLQVGDLNVQSTLCSGHDFFDIHLCLRVHVLPDCREGGVYVIRRDVFHGNGSIANCGGVVNSEVGVVTCVRFACAMLA